MAGAAFQGTGSFCFAMAKDSARAAASLWRLEPGNEVRTCILMLFSLLGCGVFLPIRIRGLEPGPDLSACLAAAMTAALAGFILGGQNLSAGRPLRFAARIHAAALSAWLAGEACAMLRGVPWGV